MSIVSSMATAISGLEANGQELAIVSDNIVNSNTTGFKSSRGEFHTILASDLMSNGGGGQVGRGCRIAGVTGQFTQGPITRTERGQDMAIMGNGFFVLRSTDNKGQSFTRDGSFRFDKDGWMTTLTGERVQAYSASPDGKITGRLTDLRIPYKTLPAKPTNNIEMHVNLDSRAPISP
jgi:flagellar hook protein FlgE